MKVLFLGATRGMGRSLSRLMAERGDHLFLVGRDGDELARSAEDLEARNKDGQAVGTHLLDLLDPTGFDAALDAADGALGQFDAAVITAGSYHTQDVLDEDPKRTATMLTVNFTNTVLLCEAIRKRLLSRGGGRLCVFSSVAGDRGRKPVMLYGASKAGLSHYLESLDHRHRADGLVTLCVKPGFVKTGMTEGLKPPPFAGKPDAVARRVLGALDRNKAMVYAPLPWWGVMQVIKRLPRFVMRRVGF